MATASGKTEDFKFPPHLQQQAELQIEVNKKRLLDKGEDELRAIETRLTQSLDLQRRNGTFSKVTKDDQFSCGLKLFIQLSAVRRLLAEHASNSNDFLMKVRT